MNDEAKYISHDGVRLNAKYEAIEGVNANEGPVCACGSDNLIIVYTATVVQGVIEYSSPEPGVWHIDEYDTAEIGYNGGINDCRIECRECGATVARADENDTDTFRLIEGCAQHTECEGDPTPDCHTDRIHTTRTLCGRIEGCDHWVIDV